MTFTRSTALAAVPLGAARHFADAAEKLLAAAQLILPHLESGRPVDAPALRGAMETAFGGSDAEGLWDWKAAYDACEAAQTLFLRKYANTLFRKYADPQARLALIEKIAGLMPTHTRRSETSQALQQFSTPAGLAYVAGVAAGFQPGERVLEPSAGTGLLAIQAEIAGSRLMLNELAETRAALLDLLFPQVGVTAHDAAHIHDYLDPAAVPDVVVMNPPFSAIAHVDARMKDAALRHIGSALARLRPSGRLVVITGASCAPDNPAFTQAFVALQERGRVLFSAAIDGRVYRKHGTTIDTRLTVIDRTPADDPRRFPDAPGVAPDTSALLDMVLAQVPPRTPAPDAPPPGAPLAVQTMAARPVRRVAAARPVVPAPVIEGIELAYTPCAEAVPGHGHLTDAIYEPYALQSIRIPGARPHPTPLVQSASMASVPPPVPSYRPSLPAHLVDDGILSDAQLESIILAGEAHGEHLAGAWTVDKTWDVISAAPDDAKAAVRFRRGWMLGDGTGAGKGRQVAGIILDNWRKGRRRAVWVSRSETLHQDAMRDWEALGQERLLVTPLSRFRQGKPIMLDEGVLFTTYATLRSQDRGEKASRVQQIVDWLGADFDGVIVFDESHAMANAAGGKSDRGDQAPSKQGRAGLRLQHALPDARIVYVSATGATTVQNLAYAQRLGLWGGEDFPFATRGEFIGAVENGGVAAMEVLARDMKALGLYSARSLSFDGVEYEMLEHALTAPQIAIYDAYAGAFQVIHNNLDAAMRAAGSNLNSQAKSAARSAFESAKQRFFNHLITAMQTPAMIASIERDLEAGHAAIIQIVSTGEALQERRLADIPTEEWDDVRVDVTPREYVLSYLEHSFPVQLYEPFSDSEGNLSSRPVTDKDGHPVESRDAIERRDRMIERLASLAPVPAALDQVLHHFGTDVVAEVTGRSRRIVKRRGSDGIDHFVVENRPGSANISETDAFQSDAKRILIFSDAGGTGRSYHADLGAKNQRLRVHYLLEAGWKADNAIQGFGRSNRTNQKQPPLFRPVTTNVKAQKRFISTIARRLDSLGAITRGQRQTGGQGLFRPEDNLESWYARDALRQLYRLIFSGKVEGCSLGEFEAATGLTLGDEGGLRDELPPITTFLNRMLALTIDLQNILFTRFEDLLTARIEGAIASGTYELGLETLQAESFKIVDRATIYTHPGTRAETRLLTIERKDRNRPVTLDDAFDHLRDRRARLLVNAQSGRAAVQIPTRGLQLDDGSVEARIRLVRPMESTSLPLAAMAETQWREADRGAFERAWQAELVDVPEFATSTMHIVAGLLLPIWKRLPQESTRVYRLQTDDGERIVGRRVSPAWAATATVNDNGPVLAPDAAFTALMNGQAILDLAEGLQLRRVRVMGVHRIELDGFTDTMRDRLKAMGLISEIISWKLRLFIPTGSDGPTVLARLLERYPLQRVGERHAA
ncbi:strawberry notch-like NTP hydrolase domain-containing protein [Sphingomonas sp. C3-2]|uniref:strawberry notch-like NTP hydrolase domain-containing protein n=1 Tax=Sphingomonas sp. C3-2 TaxID=3062169 RepID=UPI00294AE7AD|nr:strawberry notch family protein [Sphingomonas sp. C3-2]WOK36170.1 strawberry notch family protein [Sphingomonas sp. C3-2]